MKWKCDLGSEKERDLYEKQKIKEKLISRKEEFDAQIDQYNSVEIDVKFTEEDIEKSKIRLSEQQVK